MKAAFNEFLKLLKKGQALTPAQHNYLKGMYETVMEKKFNFGKIGVHIDLKARSRKNLRF